MKTEYMRDFYLYNVKGIFPHLRLELSNVAVRIMGCIRFASDRMSSVVETSHTMKAICQFFCIYARIHSRMIIVVAKGFEKKK